MTEPPEIEVTSGAPTPEEEAAIRAAILRMWRRERAEAVREAGLSRWRAAARAEATGNPAADLFEAGVTADAWKLSGRIGGRGLISVLRTGRGDSK